MKEAEPAQRTKKYTWKPGFSFFYSFMLVLLHCLARNAEEIVPVDTKLARDIDLRCDLCGLDCTEARRAPSSRCGTHR